MSGSSPTVYWLTKSQKTLRVLPYKMCLMRVLVDQKCKVYRYDFVRVEYYVMAMSLWVTLYGLLCHCGTPCISGYVIVGHPIWVAMSLWDTLYRWLCALIFIYFLELTRMAGGSRTWDILLAIFNL